MPSNDAKMHWLNRVRKLDIEIMAPQHGRLFKGEDVGRFLDWFEKFNAGVAVKKSYEWRLRDNARRHLPQVIIVLSIITAPPLKHWISLPKHKISKPLSRRDLAL